MKTFTKVIPTIAFVAMMVLVWHEPKAEAINAPKNKPSLVITAVVGKSVSTNILFFTDQHEAVEYENRLLAANPVSNEDKPHKNVVYFVTEVF